MDSIYKESFILKYKKDNSTLIWITIIVVTIIIGLIIASNYEYKKFLKIDGVVKKVEEDLYVSIYVKKNDCINVFYKNLIINNNIAKYTIIYISDEYKIDDKEVYLNILLDIKIDELLIENNILRLKWELGRTTISKEIINFIKKGLME